MPRRKVKVLRSRDVIRRQTGTVELIFDPTRITLNEILEARDIRGYLRNQFLADNNIELVEDEGWSDEDDTRVDNVDNIVEEDEEIPHPPERKIPWL